MSLMKPLFNLCKTRFAATRDGYTSSSFLMIPFIGFWSPSGQELTFPDSNLKQATDVTLAGRTMPNTYVGSNNCG